MKQSWWQLALFSVLGISSAARASESEDLRRPLSPSRLRSYSAGPSLGSGYSWESLLHRAPDTYDALDYSGASELPLAGSVRRSPTWLLSLFALFLSSTAQAACPVGYAELTSAGTPFCVQIEPRVNVRSFEAAPLCEDQSARVCSASEIEAACFSGKVNGSGLGWEWSLSLDQYLSASANGSCDALAYGELTDRASLRCCLSQ